MKERYDVIVVGGGPGGYLAAERAGARGMSVLLVEKERLGGVCLNEGCIPTKTLINAAKVYTHARESAEMGVVAAEVRFDLTAAMKWKQKTVDALVRGVESQMRRYKVDVIAGTASMAGMHTVEVGGERYEGSSVVLATGSSSAVLPIPGAAVGVAPETKSTRTGAAPRVVTSREILEISAMPGRLAVIGGGVIGMEFASLFSALGVTVDVIEMLPEIAPVMDAEISALMRKSLSGITYHLGARVESVDAAGVHFRDAAGTASVVPTDLVLMAVGRRPNTERLGFESIGLDADRKGVKVNERMETNLPGVYAVGDVTGRSLLAHSAYRMAEVAVNTIAGEDDRMRYEAVPWVVYTLPEASGCGLTEEQARAAGRSVKVAKLQMRANGRFIAENGNAPGLCKIIVDADSGTLLGLHLLGGVNSEMIYGAAAMIENELRVKDMREIVFPHPSVSEIIRDTLWEL